MDSSSSSFNKYVKATFGKKYSDFRNEMRVSKLQTFMYIYMILSNIPFSLSGESPVVFEKFTDV